MGFRDGVRTRATQLQLVGWVRNLPDNRVEALFMGKKISLDQMLEWCYSGPRMAKVTNVEYEWQQGELLPDEFQIKL